MVSSTHAVCAQGLKIAIISATVETDDPEAEIQPAISPDFDLSIAPQEPFSSTSRSGDVEVEKHTNGR